MVNPITLTPEAITHNLEVLADLKEGIKLRHDYTNNRLYDEDRYIQCARRWISADSAGTTAQIIQSTFQQGFEYRMDDSALEKLAIEERYKYVKFVADFDKHFQTAVDKISCLTKTYLNKPEASKGFENIQTEIREKIENHPFPALEINLVAKKQISSFAKQLTEKMTHLNPSTTNQKSNETEEARKAKKEKAKLFELDVIKTLKTLKKSSTVRCEQIHEPNELEKVFLKRTIGAAEGNGLPFVKNPSKDRKSVQEIDWNWPDPSLFDENENSQEDMTFNVVYQEEQPQ